MDQCREPCRHCKFYRQSHPRGLCKKCYTDRSVRARYPPLTANGSGRPGVPTELSSAEEVERCVREQYENLPDWWNDHDPD